MIDYPSNPFVESPAKEADELVALSRALRLAQGFSLLLARVSSLAHARRLEQELSRRLDGLYLYRMVLAEPIDNLLLRLREVIEQANPDAISVIGLEHSFSVSKAGDQSPLALHLNAARNSFYSAVTCPLLIWAQDIVISALAHDAPDFFSIRSGVYSFTEEDEDFAALLTHIQSEQDLSPAILQRMSERMEQLVLRTDRSNEPRAEADIYWHLGSGYKMLGPEFFSKAEENFERAIQIGERYSLPDVECKARLVLGSIALERRRPTVAAEHYERVAQQAQKARLPREECLAFIGLAGVSETTGELIAAVDFYERAQKRAREINDPALVDQALDGLQRTRNLAGSLTLSLNRASRESITSFSASPSKSDEYVQILFLFNRRGSSNRLLSADWEYAQIEKVLRSTRYGRRFRIHIASIDNSTNLLRLLRETRPHIIHFFAVEWSSSIFNALYQFRDEVYRKLFLIVIQSPIDEIDVERIARFSECTIFLGDSRSQNMSWIFYRCLGDGMNVSGSFQMARAQMAASGFSTDEPRIITFGASVDASPLDWVTAPKENQSNKSPITHATADMPPDRRGVRRALMQYLPTDSDFDAFVIDNFPSVFRLFTDGFSRTERVNLLLSRVEPIEVYAALSRYLAGHRD